MNLFNSLSLQYLHCKILCFRRLSVAIIKSKSNFHTIIKKYQELDNKLMISPPRSAYLNRIFNTYNKYESTIGGKNNLQSSAAISKYQAYEMVHKLTDDERISLKQALNKYESDKLKAKLEGQLAATRWRSRFNRRNNITTLGDVDPTGTYCAMPEDWLQIKLAEVALPPTRDELLRIMIVSAVPFIGFGFLDNFFMIIAGDYIEHTMGIYMSISTMAAAGLGNTISDILGLGLAHYVELFCEFIGLKPPKLTPSQIEMKSSRRSASIGRALGITIGCLLGMCPLFFINKKKDEDTKNAVVNKNTDEKM